MLRRKICPWIGSLAVHCLLIVVPLTIVGRAAAGPESMLLDIDIQNSGSGPSKASELKQPMPKTPSPPPVSKADSVARTASETTLEESEGGVPAAAPVAAAQEEPAVGGSPEIRTEIGWQSASRSIVKRGALSFPRILSTLGQEAECEARITVTPLGMVSKVEITRSSGYTEIDASVETALRGYVFTRDYGIEKKNAIGIVKLRFRLERLD